MGERAPYTAFREQQLALAARGSSQPTPPPYHTYDVDLLYLMCRFDLLRARKVLPPQLELSDEGLGLIMIVNARRGWIIAPFTACVTTLQVKGYDGPDNYPGNYVHTAFYSGLCGDLFRHFYNDRITTGFAHMQTDAHRIEASGGRDGFDTIRISARRTDRVTDEVVGMNNYLSSYQNGIQVYSTSYSARFQELEDVRIEVFDTAPEPMRSLQPLEVVWPLFLEGMSLNFNSGHPLGASQATIPAEAALAAIFDLLSRFRKAAAIVTQSGRLLFVTPEATRLLGESPGALIASQTLLGGPAPTTSALRDPVTLFHSSGQPILAQVMPMLHGLGEEPLKLVLLIDPKNETRGDPEPILQLMGLTPAEARLASRVGRGLSHKDAAIDLGIAAQTARSAMKSIFDKLQLSRQSQLAQLVTRLEAL